MKDRRLIVNADDLGMTPEVDEGILKTVSCGIVTSATLLVNPPFRGDFKRVSSAGASLGIHFNLSLGKPCSPILKIPSLVDPDGNFISDLNEIISRFNEKETENELYLQLETFKNLVGRNPCQITFHKHLHARNDGILGILLSMARKIDVPLRAIDGRMRKICGEAGVATTDNFIGDVQPSPYWTIQRLREKLSALGPGTTELMCHPAKQMKPIPGVWYQKERDTELETFTSKEIRKIMSKFDLMSFEKAFPRDPSWKEN